MAKIKFKVYEKFHGEGQEYEIEAEESNELTSFLKSYKDNGMSISYKSFIRFCRINKIKHSLL